MQIAVAGGTGWIGRPVVEVARAQGHHVVVLTRSTGVDLISGRGLEAALTGSTAVIDVSNLNSTRRKRSVGFFGTATRNLTAAGHRAGVTHHVALSIVGIDRVDLGYYAGKQHQEDLVLTGPVPGSVLRATQFHEFAAQMLQRGGPFAIAPRMRSQPIAAREVAQALVELAGGPPVGRAPDLAGPQVHEMPDLVRRLLQARGSHRLVVPVPVPGAAGRAMAGGALLPTGPGPRGRQTFDEWLAAGNGLKG